MGPHPPTPRDDMGTRPVWREEEIWVRKATPAAFASTLSSLWL